MCYVLLLSTTSDKDLSCNNDDLLSFAREIPPIGGITKLKHAHHWYVGSRLGCSCGFRHLYSTELGFDGPVDWYPEEPDDIQATLRLIRIVRDLIEGGAEVDCVDAWSHADMNPLAEAEIEVDLASISDSAFRFFENHHFSFSLTAKLDQAADSRPS